MDSFLMSAAAPWVISLGMLALGIALLVLGVRGSGAIKLVGRAAGAFTGIIGILMIFGATSVQLAMNDVKSAYPMPGKLVDIGSTTTHLWCEGPLVDGEAPIVWLSGSYGQALWMKPLHDRIKEERRSCMIDRPGLGWAGAASLPRSVDQVLEETHATLIKGGEQAPFVMIGHSYGGLYSANFADAYPDDVEAVVLLDPTPPAWFVEQQGRWGCGSPSPSKVMVLGAMFGLGQIPALNPLLQPQSQPLKDAIGEDDWKPLVQFETRPSSLVANASALHAGCAEPFSVVRAPGALGDLPMLTIIQTRDDDWQKWAPEGLSPRQTRNWERWADVQGAQYGTLSSRSEVIKAPAGGTHYFPLLLPDFTMEKIEGFLAELASVEPDALDGLPSVQQENVATGDAERPE
ncbi:MAG: alpha/beta hydrolase [Pseudomonadota bacterium]